LTERDAQAAASLAFALAGKLDEVGAGDWLAARFRSMNGQMPALGVVEDFPSP
jgi:hypothetical protein